MFQLLLPNEQWLLVIVLGHEFPSVAISEYFIEISEIKNILLFLYLHDGNLRFCLVALLNVLLSPFIFTFSQFNRLA